MILLLFYIISTLMSILIVLFGNRTFTIIAMGFALLHILFTIYCWANLGKTELIYFTYTRKEFFAFSIINYSDTCCLSWIHICFRG